MLPLLVCNSRAHWVLEQALSAAAPYTGLLAVVRNCPLDAMQLRMPRSHGCAQNQLQATLCLMLTQ